MALEEEFRYYTEHQDSFVKKYNGKVIVLKGNEVVGVYDSDIEAYIKAQEQHKLGTFLIQRVSSGANEYTQTFQSRVIFPAESSSS